MRTLTFLLASLLLPASALADSPWEQRLEQALSEGAAAPTAQWTFAIDAQPRPTRAGFLRFTSDEMNSPEASPVVLDRLANGDESVAVRAALADVFSRQSEGWGDALLELLAEEPAQDVRAVLVHGLRKVDGATARAGFELALGDSDPGVRAEAARLVSRRRDGAELASMLFPRLQDVSGEVRAEAARSLGALGVQDAAPRIEGLLGDADGKVRLAALAAVQRLAPESLDLPTLRRLADDQDPRVARRAAGLLD